MRLTIATWNINSVRLRINLVARFVKSRRPTSLPAGDEVPRQRVPALEFPQARLSAMSRSTARRAITASPSPRSCRLTEVDRRGFCDKGDARHLAATVTPDGAPARLHNFYVPAGGDEPDPLINPKFAHKLAFLDEMAAWFGRRARSAMAMPFSSAISTSPRWRPTSGATRRCSASSATPRSRSRSSASSAPPGRGSTPCAAIVPAEEKLYTWWSYRARDWALSNRAAGSIMSGSAKASRRALAACKWWPRAAAGSAPPITRRCWFTSISDRGPIRADLRSPRGDPRPPRVRR